MIKNDKIEKRRDWKSLKSTCNEQISQNPRRNAHCKISFLVTVCRRSFAAKANLLALLTRVLSRRQQSADHKDKVCQVGVTANTE